MGLEMHIPMHIGFIMDGNGRWAKAQGMPRTYGHIKGADNVENIVKLCFEYGIKVVSLYAFSTENWVRPKDEVEKIFDLISNFLRKYINKLKDNKIRLLISGDLSILPSDLKTLCEDGMRDTANYSEFVLNIAINYGGRQELVHAFNELLKQGKSSIVEKDIQDNLYTSYLPDIDLIVRTSGEQRLSNFFLFQSAYSELYFSKKHWPDFDKAELDEAITWYSSRKRRFGGV